jgi:hypothetical protein
MVSYTIPHRFPIGNANDAPRRSAGLPHVTSGASPFSALANLRALPAPFGFTVACFPVTLAGGSASWSRSVAIFP